MTKIQGGVGQFKCLLDDSGLVLLAKLTPESLQPEVKDPEEKDLFTRSTTGTSR